LQGRSGQPGRVPPGVWDADCATGGCLRCEADWRLPGGSCAGGACGSTVLMLTGGIEDDDGK
jgi:hypothetical protein